MKVKSVPILGPANDLFGLTIPSCCNAISAEADTAYLLCPEEELGPDIFSVDPETWEHRKQIVKMFIGEDGLYAAPYFAEDTFGHWMPGGAYILVPVEMTRCISCGYEIFIDNTAVPLYDFWVRPGEPEEILKSAFASCLGDAGRKMI